VNRAGHLVPAVLFAAVAIVWSFPLVLHLTTHIPGDAAGDNLNFLWNFWWIRTALDSNERLFFTRHLFAPIGTDLTLHTHTALPAVIAATLLRPLPVIAGLNLTILASLFLNGFCAYLLAWRTVRDKPAAIVAGLIFGGSPYVAAHLTGHFNLTAVWMFPLFAIAAAEMLRGSRGWAVVAGVVVAATAYIDYYYVIYELACALCIVGLTARTWSIEIRGASALSRRLTRGVVALILLVVALIVAIAATGGFEWRLGPQRISAHDTFNPRQILWVLLVVAAWLHWRPRVRSEPASGWNWRRAAGAAAIAAGTCAVLAGPILWLGFEVLRRGDYVTQEYFWRSAPKGIDAGTLVMGNPLHGVWGSAVVGLYDVFQIDWIETGGWIGVAPLVLAIWVVRRYWGVAAVRYWTAIGVVFFVWALGPHLMTFGWNTGMILPQTLLRYVPIVSNARIPGRAIVVTYLALAMLVALGVAAWRSSGRRSAMPLAVLTLLIVIDYIPAPFALTYVDHPGIYDTLRDLPGEGALLELPVGTRDSFGGRGLLDHRVLAYQMIHGRPIVGGAVSRLSPAITRAYREDPLIDNLLKLSETRGTGPESWFNQDDKRLVGQQLKKDGIGFVMVNDQTAPSALLAYVERMMPLTLIAREGERSLYAVE
jgi:hypothetical protein